MVFLTVFQPLLADLIAAHLIGPDGFGYGSEVLVRIDVQPLFVRLVAQPGLLALADAAIALTIESACRRIEFG